MKEFIKTQSYKKLITVIAIILGTLIVFSAGMRVGFRQASYSYQWNDSYARQFGGLRSPFMMMRGGDRDDPRVSHGAAGTVVAIRLPSVVIKGPSESEKIILISTSTTIRQFHDLAASTTIRVGDTLVVLGAPDPQGQIHASLIRIMPGASNMGMMTSSSTDSNIIFQPY
jgi:hypothetical protein